ncbi:MAG: phosphate ABC transporter substrate-binding protein [Pseudohongiellaceae bacterium]|jgi:ABC-type phosphate transport system substrate-binding protein
MKHLITCFVATILVAAVGSASAEVVVIVNANAGIDSLDKAYVADLFLAKKASFPGGGNAVPVDQGENSGDREEFHEKVTGKSNHQLTSHWSRLVFSGKGKPPREFESGARIMQLVSENPEVIGYVDSSLVTPAVKVVLIP